MRVLHVIPGISWKDGGPSRAVLEMAHALQGQGLNVVIVTPYEKNELGYPSLTPGSGLRSVLRNGVSLEHNGLNFIFFSWQGMRSFMYSPSLARWAEAHVREFDVVHIHAIFSHPCIAVGAACRRQGIPYIVRPLGSLDPTSLRRNKFGKLLLWHLGVKQLLRGAAAIHYTSERELRVAETPLGLNQGVVIPLGVNEPVPGDHGEVFLERPYVLFLSRIHPKKNVEVLIQAFRKAIDETELNHWRLVIAGDGERSYVDRLKSNLGQTGPEEWIEFVGWVEGARKAALQRNASLFALVSEQENFGLSMVEALAYGVPVLVSDRMDLAENIIQSGAGWVTPIDELSITDVLKTALCDQTELSSRGKAGRDMASRLSWTAVGEKLTYLYASIPMQNNENKL